jgi:hypothetical protein
MSVFTALTIIVMRIFWIVFDRRINKKLDQGDGKARRKEDKKKPDG